VSPATLQGLAQNISFLILPYRQKEEENKPSAINLVMFWDTEPYVGRFLSLIAAVVISDFVAVSCHPSSRRDNACADIATAYSKWVEAGG
jgi:hypothetical protein